MTRISLLVTVLIAVGLGGCFVRGDIGATAYVEQPSAELVYVSPGVYVVADYNEPIFYSDNYYWAQRDGYWYRSGYYRGGWVRVQSAPHVVTRIERPQAYVHYHGEGRARMRVQDHSRGGGRGRGHNSPPRGRARVKHH